MEPGDDTAGVPSEVSDGAPVPVRSLEVSPADLVPETIATGLPRGLSLKDPDPYQRPLADWPLPLAPPFMGSRELDILATDLRNYVHGRVRGRSYLIAGHRGSGKTALVSRAVDQLASAIMRQSVLESPTDLPDGPLQRPLLVKLHGPTMLEEPARVSVSKAPAGPVGGPAGDPEAGAREEPGDVSAGVHAALVQITLGLYRTVAQTAATGFRAHAIQGRGHLADERIELAAQLALDLDGGASPAPLRSYWRRLDRLRRGILWPATADPTCAAHGMSDQGFREIAALATAAQAFQVCTGRINYTSSVTESEDRKQISELKGTANLKDALGRLGTLGIGAATGVSVLATTGGSALPALAAGFGVWLLGTLGLTWTRTTERNAKRSVDYSFIRDFSLATLERDLPVVITRVRDAGLVPVFVIDELDKVPDAHQALSDLVGRLKHLIADFGFFCFLVNRDCFETVEARIRNGAYPTEHTLFSERLLLHPDPAYAVRYLMELVEGDLSDPQFPLARATFALGVMHQAQLNLTDMMRRLARSVTPPSKMLGTSADLTETRRLILATVQIAIDEILRSPPLAARMVEAPGFAQLAIDTVYDPSRTWAQGAVLVDPSANELKARLEKRRWPSGQEKDPDQGDVVADGSIASVDLDLLQSHLVALLELLCDLPALRLRLGDRTVLGHVEDPSFVDVRLADIPPENVPHICVALDDGKYRFVYDRDGEPIVEAPGRLTDEQKALGESLIAYTTEFEGLLTQIGITFDDLARTPLIKSVSSDVIAQAKSRLSAALRRGGHDPDVAQHLLALERFHAEVAGQSDKLGELLILAASLMRDVEETALVMPALTRLVPFDLPPKRWVDGRAVPVARKLPPDVAGLRQWRGDYLAWLVAAPGDLPSRGPDDYQPLAEPLIKYFAGANPRSDLLRADYSLLVRAARDELPSAAMHSRFSSLTTGDWSRLTLAAAPRGEQAALAPYWVFVAGLRGLGFSKDALSELSGTDLARELAATGWKVETPDMTMEQCFDRAARVADSAPAGPGGLLVIENAEQRYSHEKPGSRRPTLIIDRTQLASYIPVLNWLGALGILAGAAEGLSAGTDGTVDE